MQKALIMFIVFIGLTSCQFFETEKISSETFLEEEIKLINWNDVDSYPVFKECEGVSGKQETKSCFETTLSNYLYNSINSEKIIVSNEIIEEVLIEFIVNEKGNLKINSIAIDSLLQAELPLLKNYILKSIDSLQPIAPAYKRGIPVRTTFKLPLAIKTD
ncbi:MAG: hypothetical protein IMY67_05025 [Bacteroidetes bacterium]|nr:hypothetical protein [Bacteroidota bacterium]